jgi:hypothetical protein
MDMSPTRSRAKTRTEAGPVSPDALAGAPQMFLAQSARAALFGLDAFEANLRIWRAVGEAMSEMARRQHEVAVQSMRERLPAENGEALAPMDAMSLTAPFEAARAAYEKMGDALLAAQRRTLEAMTDTADPAKAA